jgi:hypothetical protein
VLEDVGRTYAASMKKRYDRFSRGGGDWAPLKPATLAGRRRQGIRHKRILYAFGPMFAAFELGKSLTLAIRALAVTVKFDLRTKLGKRSRYHDEGAGRLPARQLLPSADETTLKKMQDVASRGVKPILRDAVNAR